MSRQGVTYWVMYNEGTRDGSPLWKGHEFSNRNTQHVGYSGDGDDDDSGLASAKRDVLKFRDLASQGKHFLNERQWPNLVLNSAWIEVERREKMEF